MRMTHNAVITSLLRRALGITVSCRPPDLLRRVDTQIVNIAARKIGGLSRSARTEGLHLALGPSAIYNSYMRHSAEILDASLRAHNSTISTRLLRELRRFYSVEALGSQDTEKIIRANAHQQVPDTEQLLRHWRHTFWFCR